MSGIFDLTQVRRSFGRAAASYDEHAALQKEVQQRLQERLADTLAADVRIQLGARGQGQLVIRFSGTEQFQGLLERLGLAGEGD